ncbi:hypothetical protein [Lacibacter sp.]|uniref:hypothetical protein n=1 Tax=Lacibacter sp. TaxID=1915409 RepID=UPI002B4AEF1C|nr:hypothetical protein [Lacibacter sp.]HLP39533.1 hypothetical protein [Lacibacter sp.]
MICAVLYSCKDKEAAASIITEQHDVQIHYPGIGMIYIDKGDCTKLLRSDSVSATTFVCYRIGVLDSVQTKNGNASYEEEKSVYYQYNMEHDWKALYQGDSLSPVFFHVTNRKQKNRFEGVLVFETPTGKNPDTLIYNDTYGVWGKQLIVLNR